MESKGCVLITGASSGIGFRTAELFASRGWTVIATTRTGQEFPIHPSIRGMTMDVDRPESIDACFSALAKDRVIVDVLVNNAGWGMKLPFMEMQDEKIASMMQTNVLGAMRTACVWITKSKPTHGILINIGSMAGEIGLKHYAVYAATKHALDGWSKALVYEQNTLGITVKIVEPLGKVETNFFRDIEEDTGYTIRAIDVAEKVWEAATDGKKRLRYVVGAPMLRLAMLFHRLLPSFAMKLMAHRYRRST